MSDDRARTGAARSMGARRDDARRQSRTVRTQRAIAGCQHHIRARICVALAVDLSVALPESLVTTLLAALYAGARALRPTDRARVAEEFLPLPPSKSNTDVTTLRLPRKLLRLVHAWIEIHRDELAAIQVRSW